LTYPAGGCELNFCGGPKDILRKEDMSRAFTKRLPREIANVGDLSGSGIYYVAASDSMLKGHALIIGNSDSVYADAFLFFEFTFTEDYPFSPPKVKFLTSDGKTRLHPNLYVCGKVCLSILGTYTGPSWQSTMSLSMILLSLKALLDMNPMTHEPGWEKVSLQDERALSYSKYVRAKIIEWSYFELKKRQYLSVFEDYIPHVISQSQKSITEVIREEATFADTLYAHLPYSMSGSTQWKQLNLLLQQK
jgi:ubiquitin-protein ligase